MAYQKVEGHGSLYKEENTGLIVRATDDTLRQQYRIAKNNAMTTIDTRDDLKDLAKEVEELKGLREEMKDIKSLLIELVNNKVT